MLCSRSETARLSCSILQSSGTLCIKSPKLEVFESFQSSPLGRGSDRDTNHSLEGGGEWRGVTVSAPPQLPANLHTSALHWLFFTVLEPMHSNVMTWTRRHARCLQRQMGKMCSHSDTVHKEAQSWMRTWASHRERERLPLPLYNELQSISQAQNDNRIQLTSNGFTAHINLSLCGVTNGLTPSVSMEFSNCTLLHVLWCPTLSMAHG